MGQLELGLSEEQFFQHEVDHQIASLHKSNGGKVVSMRSGQELKGIREDRCPVVPPAESLSESSSVLIPMSSSGEGNKTGAGFPG